MADIPKDDPRMRMSRILELLSKRENGGLTLEEEKEALSLDVLFPWRKTPLSAGRNLTKYNEYKDDPRRIRSIELSKKLMKDGLTAEEMEERLRLRRQLLECWPQYFGKMVATRIARKRKLET
jgi:uncharacterized protein YnzC (UPF0291/DUF896 family)